MIESQERPSRGYNYSWAIGSSPPQKPQPIFADLWYLGSRMRWEQSRVTICHFF